MDGPAAPCGACEACPGFAPNRMRPHKCFHCFHEALEHDGLRDEDQARAVLSRGGDREPCEIVPRFLYMGGMRAAVNAGALRAAGVTRVVNCARGLAEIWPRFRERPDLFAYTHLGLADALDQPVLDAVLEALAALAAERDAGGRVFVHCAQGVSRSGAVVVAWLMRDRGLPYDEALAEARRGRVVCRPNRGFEEQLRRARAEGRL